MQQNWNWIVSVHSTQSDARIAGEEGGCFQIRYDMPAWLMCTSVGRSIQYFQQ